MLDRELIRNFELKQFSHFINLQYYLKNFIDAEFYNKFEYFYVKNVVIESKWGIDEYDNQKMMYKIFLLGELSIHKNRKFRNVNSEQFHRIG